MISKGMFLVPSTLDFKTRMEILEVPIWVKVPHFPFVLLDTIILKLIKDNLGCYIEDVEIKTRIIQVVVDLRQVLLNAIQLDVVYQIHLQILDYEQILFNSNSCHDEKLCTSFVQLLFGYLHLVTMRKVIRQMFIILL